MALADLDLFKLFLQDPTVPDAVANAALTAASAAVETYCHRKFLADDYIEYYTANGTRFIPLRQRPVIEIENVWLDYSGNYGQTDDAFSSETLLTAGEDYVLRLDPGSNDEGGSGLLVRVRGIWVEHTRVRTVGTMTADSLLSPGNIKVSYRAGYETIPDDIQAAVCFVATAVLREGRFGAPVQGETLGRASYEIARRWMSNNPDLGSARQILSKYREVSW